MNGELSSKSVGMFLRKQTDMQAYLAKFTKLSRVVSISWITVKYINYVFNYTVFIMMVTNYYKLFIMSGGKHHFNSL